MYTELGVQGVGVLGIELRAQNIGLLGIELRLQNVGSLGIEIGIHGVGECASGGRRRDSGFISPNVFID